MEIVAMINTVAAKAHLEAQLMELKERQDRIAQGLAEPLNPDFSEQAVQMENDIPLEGQAALIAREIASVMRALTRIEHGTYGQRVRCDARAYPRKSEIKCNLTKHPTEDIEKHLVA
jgi:DnaK suppressor protein